MFDAENFREFRIGITFGRGLLSIQYIILISVYLAQSMLSDLNNNHKSDPLTIEINLVLLVFRY